MNAENCDQYAKRQVERDEELVQLAVGACEEPVEDASKSDDRSVHARSRANENPFPQARVGHLPFLGASLGPGVSEVDEKNQATYEMFSKLSTKQWVKS